MRSQPWSEPVAAESRLVKTAGMRAALALQGAMEAYRRSFPAPFPEESLAPFAELMADPEGRAALLAEIDRETNGQFLNALLSRLGERSAVCGEGLSAPDFAEPLWRRFLAETDLGKKNALLGFFADEPRLRERHLSSFAEIAVGDVPQAGLQLRLRAVAALRMRSDDPDVADTIRKVAAEAPAGKVRAAAIFALAETDDPASAALVLKGLDDPDEQVRMAAISTFRPRQDVASRERWSERLRQELANGGGRVYRCALLDRMLEGPRADALRAVEDEAAREKGDGAREYFGALRALLADSRAGVPEIRGLTASLRQRYQFGR